MIENTCLNKESNVYSHNYQKKNHVFYWKIAMLTVCKECHCCPKIKIENTCEAISMEENLSIEIYSVYDK